MRQVRNSVFETNSSSMHSITMHGLKDRMCMPHEQANIEIEFGEYGWEMEQYSSYHDKLSYVTTLIQYHLGYPWDSEEMDKKNIVNTIISSKYYKWIEEMVWDYCKKTLSLRPMDDEWNPAGYVDHESVGILGEWWSEDEIEFKENMKNFIFNDRYGFVTDNDNH